MTNHSVGIPMSKSNEPSSWTPKKGNAFLALIANTKLSDAEKECLSSETISILSGCIEPGSLGRKNTGLVIGYVQSGKTMSFTSLTALASDNGYRLIIVLAGTTNNLVEQCLARLKKDLDVVSSRDWNLFTTQQKAFNTSHAARVGVELGRWRRGRPNARTILIVTMKHHQHLENLSMLLRDSSFDDIPTLIIDDEGDQAGMNTKAKLMEESATYACIKTLRSLFSQHSYVLYTATPQAPLLISRIDALSPSFGCVLTPGVDYIGGREFFVEGRGCYIKTIPSEDVVGKNEEPLGPPFSLMLALRDFFVGVSIGLLEGDHMANRSMMIHPDRKSTRLNSSH